MKTPLAQQTIFQLVWSLIRKIYKSRSPARWRAAMLLFFLQFLYFPLNKRGHGDRDLSIKQLDGPMPRISWFVAPYLIGFAYIASVNFVAALSLSPKHFREHCIAMATATLTGFTFWYFYPAKVEKRVFVPREDNLFDVVLRWLQVFDKSYGKYNSFPSSHIYYVTIGLHYQGKEFPQHRWWLNSLIGINAASTVLTHQHYVIDVAAGFALSRLAVRLADKKLAPLVQQSTD